MDYKSRIPRVKIKYISLIILATILFLLIVLTLVLYKNRTKLDAINFGSGLISGFIFLILLSIPLLVFVLFMKVRSKNKYEELRHNEDAFKDFKNNEKVIINDNELIERLRRRKE